MSDGQYEELLRFVIGLSEEQREYEIRFEALRVLLLARGVISNADFEASLAELKKIGGAAFEEGLESFQRAEKDRQLERLREMLRRHEGTKQ